MSSPKMKKSISIKERTFKIEPRGHKLRTIHLKDAGVATAIQELHKQTQDFHEVRAGVDDAHQRIVNEEDDFVSHIETERSHLDDNKAEVIGELKEITEKAQALLTRKIEKEKLEAENTQKQRVFDDTTEYKTVMFTRS